MDKENRTLDASSLTPMAANLWQIERPLKAPGLRVGHRMTVARLCNGEVWVHSPVEFDHMLACGLESLGPVKHFIAPSRQHDLHWWEWFEYFPAATFYCAPGTREEHRDLPFHRVLSASVNEAWETELPKVLVRGMPKINEFVFLHRPTRTLVVADLVFNFDYDRQSFLGKLFLKLNGLSAGVGCSRIFKSFIKDRAAFEDSVREILAWDFDRLVPGHGAIVEGGGKSVLQAALRG